jgi:uncharacterized protein YcfL
MIKNIIFIFLIASLIIGCRSKNEIKLERNIIDCFKTTNYSFIINNSIPDISERFITAQLQNYNEFNIDTEFKVLTHEKMYDEFYALLIEADNDKTIYVQYEKQNDNSVVLQYLNVEKK